MRHSPMILPSQAIFITDLILLWTMKTSQTACSTMVSSSSGRNTAQIIRNIFSFRTLGALLSQIQPQDTWSWDFNEGETEKL